MAGTEFINILGSDSGMGGDTAMFRKAGRTWPKTLPILGLSDIVIFPGMVSPLLVESAPSIRLIDDVVGGDRLIGLVFQTDSKAENPGLNELHKHGCLARVLKMLKFPDNSVRILVEGLRRFEITGAESEDPYLVAKVSILHDIKDDSAELSALTPKRHQSISGDHPVVSCHFRGS